MRSRQALTGLIGSLGGIEALKSKWLGHVPGKGIYKHFYTLSGDALTEFMNSILVFTFLLREWILSSASLLLLLVFEVGEILSRVVPLQ